MELSSVTKTHCSRWWDSAVEEALFWLALLRLLPLFTVRDELRAQKFCRTVPLQMRKSNLSGILLSGNQRWKPSRICHFENVKQVKWQEQAFGGVFIYVGLDPELVILLRIWNIQDQAGWIVTDNHMKTAVDGIFAVGDVRQKDLRQVTTAVGDGAIAGQKPINLLLNIVKQKKFPIKVIGNFFIVGFGKLRTWEWLQQHCGIEALNMTIHVEWLSISSTCFWYC